MPYSLDSLYCRLRCFKEGIACAHIIRRTAELANNVRCFNSKIRKNAFAAFLAQNDIILCSCQVSVNVKIKIN